VSYISVGPVYMQRPSLWLLLAAICKGTTNELNHKDHEAHKERTKAFCQDYCGGLLTHYPILNPVTIRCRSGSGARPRALVSGHGEGIYADKGRSGNLWPRWRIDPPINRFPCTIHRYVSADITAVQVSMAAKAINAAAGPSLII